MPAPGRAVQLSGAGVTTTQEQPGRTRAIVTGAALVGILGVGLVMGQLEGRPPASAIRTVARPAPEAAPPLVSERFEPWYDNRAWDVQGGALRYHYQTSTSERTVTLPDSGSATRIQFPPQAAIRLSYRVLYKVGWVGTAPGTCCEHELYVLTTASDRYSPLARTALTVYAEQHVGRAVVRIQDGLNIDTPHGDVSGCMAIAGSVGSELSCYTVNGVRNNVRSWLAPVIALTPGEWHRVEVELRLNTLGQADGLIRLSVDGTRMISATDVVFRTTAYPDMLFNQLVLAPYLPRSVADQAFWLDNVVVRPL